MARGGRDHSVLYGRILFGVAFALLILAFTWQVSTDRATFREAARQQAEGYARDSAGRMARLCETRRGEALHACIAAVLDASREHQRAEQELAAQREVASWTLYMLMLSAAALLVSGFGLAALLRTIVQGKEGLKRADEANRIALETGQRQLRAYLVAEEFRIRDFVIGRKPAISYKIVNAGSTPAYGVRARAQLIEAKGRTACEQKVFFDKPRRKIPAKVVGPGQDMNPEFHYSNPLTAKEAKRVRDGKIKLGLFGVITYSDVFRQRHCVTFKVFLLPEWFDARGGARFAMCDRGNAAS